MEISRILSELSSLMDDELTTEREVEAKLRRAVMRLMAEDKLDAEVGFESILEAVKESLFEVPHSITSPHFPERFEMDGVHFYHTHTCKPDADMIGRAFERYWKAKEFLEILPKLGKITDDFFKGYMKKEGVIRRYTKNKHESFVFYSPMDDVFEDLKHHLKLAEIHRGRYCVIVPVERSPKNFINFYRKHSEDAKKSGLRIWVANYKNMTVDPFIGYPKDLSLIRNFKNPRVASMISSFWRSDVREID